MKTMFLKNGAIYTSAIESNRIDVARQTPL